jgi:hypothetical protein
MNPNLFKTKVKFLLDGVHPGEGIVLAVYQHSIEVDLTKPCKEFDAGVVIIVDISEIVS